MKAALLILISFFFSIKNCFPQKENNIWYFGQNAGLDFSVSPPLLLTNGQLSTTEGCVTVSDKNGTLLFYSDGVTIWDRSHTTMPNGTGLLGHSSTTQSLVVFPSPSVTGQYYVFTLGVVTSTGDLHYSIVDMNLNGTMGDVVAGQKNIFVSTGLTEKLAVAKAACANTYWIMVHKRNTNEFYAYKIDSGGIFSPVISSTGPVMNQISGYGWAGVLKFSSDYKKVSATNAFSLRFLYDFNNATGIVSNPMQLSYTPIAGSIPYTYGLCFSPDNSKLYAGEGSSSPVPVYYIYQYDLSSGTVASIVASKALIGAPKMSGFIQGDLALGPDNKIYVAKDNLDSLAIIQNPDGLGLTCIFTDNAISLGGRKSKLGLQNPVVVADSVSDPTCDIALSLNRFSGSFKKIWDNPTEEFSLGPNPFIDRFYIHWKEDPPLQIRIYDLSGSLIYRNIIPERSPLEINFSSISFGLYIIEIDTRKDCTKKKIYKIQN
jgi:hypothetical protein